MTKRAPFDSLASAAAKVLVRRMARGANADDREWLDAMSAEIGEIDGGWARLRWALGAVRTNWECRRRRFAVASVVSIGGSRMTHDVTDRFQHPVNMIAYSAVGFFVWWLCLGFAMRLVNSRVASSWAVSEIVMGFACLIGVAVATALRMSLLTWFLVAFVGVFTAEFSMHTMFGIKSVQGGPAHLTVLGAALLAVIGFVQFEKRFLPAASVAMACVLAFIAAEALSHIVFGLNPFRDRVTHAAIFLAAFVAPVFAAMFSGNRNAV